MSNLTTFNFGSNAVRSLIINGEPEIVDNDICDVTWQDNITEEHFFTGDVGFDALRFQWLTADHSNANERQYVQKILDRIGTMSISSARQAVDDAMGCNGNLWSESLNTLTFCVLVLENGTTITGESVCASPENFNTEFGRNAARENAVQKIF